MGEVIDIDAAKNICAGCPAVNEELIESGAREECPFYKTYTDYADGGSVEIKHHECHNPRLLGDFVGSGLLEMKQIDPFTGQEIR